MGNVGNRLVSRSYAASKLASVMVLSIGCLVLVGWFFDITVPKGILPQWVTMKPNAAVALVFCGLALWLLQKKIHLAQAFACAVLIIGFLTISQYLFGWNLEIDQLLVKELPKTVQAPHSARMAPITALNFIMIGGAFLLLSIRRFYRLAQGLILAAILFAFLACLGYFYEAPSLTGFAKYTKMAMHAALAFLILGVGMLCAFPEKGIVAIVIRENVGGLTARRLLPLVVALPIILGLLFFKGLHISLYSINLGIALFVIAVVVILVFVVLWNAVSLSRVALQHQQAEEELQQKTLEIERSNKELEEFAYAVSHDLKAPLRGISRLSEWLVQDYGDQLGEDGKKQLRMLYGRTCYMQTLIDGILEYSRIGRVREHITAIDLREVIEQVIDLLQPPPQIDIEFEGNLPRIHAEKTRIHQLFQNLLGNAIKFMDKPKGMIRIRCEDAGNMWRFSVSDNGPGIDEKYFDRIFQLFQTLGIRDEMGGDTGVGLALVKKIVRLYGGKIQVHSEVGKGSTFIFTLSKSLTAKEVL